MSSLPLVAPLTYPVHPESIDIEPFVEGRYRLRFAGDEADLDAVLRLRFEVFNLELNEGLDAAYLTGRDEDRFDRVCHHLIVEDTRSGAMVGTYRIQTAEMIREGFGFYSADEFHLGALSRIIPQAVEIGRACVAREHRNRRVLFLLWKGLAAYLRKNGKRYLFGCCSLSGLDPAEGARALGVLRSRGVLHPRLKTPVQPAYAAAHASCEDESTQLPALFETYLRYGAKVCGGPAIDREFKTIDFLVLLDVNDMDDRAWSMFFGRQRDWS